MYLLVDESAVRRCSVGGCLTVPDDVDPALRRVPFAVVLLIQNHRRHTSVSPPSSGFFVGLVPLVCAVNRFCVGPHRIIGRQRVREKVRAMGGSEVKLKSCRARSQTITNLRVRTEESIEMRNYFHQ